MFMIHSLAAEEGISADHEDDLDPGEADGGGGDNVEDLHGQISSSVIRDETLLSNIIIDQR